MQKIITLSILSGIFLLAACSKNYSVEALVEDDSKRTEILNECAMNMKKLESENCKNALKAEAQATANMLK